MQNTEKMEPGNNVFELIEFTVTQPQTPENASVKNMPQKPMRYGVNVAKVREVIRMPEIVPCLTTCPEALGVFNLRGIPIPAIHLALALGYTNDVISPTHQMIVTEFSGRVAGFVVATTHRIRRVNWEKILPPTSEAFRSITGMMLLENDEFLFMIDFEDIVSAIDRKSGAGRTGISSSRRETQPRYENAPTANVEQNEAVILVVEDSPVARKTVVQVVRELGFQVIEASDGEIAWNILTEAISKKAHNQIRAIVTDIEMPRLDGFSLIGRIREEKNIHSLPIVVHSSLTGESNRRKAISLGANAFANKFNRKEIIESLQEVLALKAGDLL